MLAHLDGDDVGSALELMLLDGEVENARRYSGSVRRAIESVQTRVGKQSGVDVLVYGGDDIVIRWSGNEISLEFLDDLRRLFEQECGRTMSIGVGHTSAEATHALRRAKISGKNATVLAEGVKLP